MDPQSPLLEEMSRDAPDQEDHSFYEDTPAYKALKDAKMSGANADASSYVR